jgi:hypothetical protein
MKLIALELTETELLEISCVFKMIDGFNGIKDKLSSTLKKVCADDIIESAYLAGFEPEGDSTDDIKFDDLYSQAIDFLVNIQK